MDGVKKGVFLSQANKNSQTRDHLGITVRKSKKRVDQKKDVYGLVMIKIGGAHIGVPIIPHRHDQLIRCDRQCIGNRK